LLESANLVQKFRLLTLLNTYGTDQHAEVLT
jgi:hypothetical protein